MLPSVVDPNDSTKMLMAETEFKHPLFMNLLMFMGEASLLFILYI